MQLRNTSDRWGAVQQILHRVVAPLVLVQLALGVYIAGLPGEEVGGRAAFAWHASIGVTILALMVGRLIWRRASPDPEAPQRLGGHERRLMLLRPTPAAMPSSSTCRSPDT